MAMLNKSHQRRWGTRSIYEPNTFIGGIGGTINTPRKLANTLGIHTRFIKKFKVIGNDVECAIIKPYDIKEEAFQNNTDITYYRDEGGNLKNIEGAAFRNATEIEEFKALEIETIGGIAVHGHGAFRGCIKLKRCLTGQNLWRVNRNTWTECTLLEEVDVSTVTSFVNSGTGLFSDCKSLPFITFNDSVDLGEMKSVFEGSVVNGVDLGGITKLGWRFMRSATVNQNNLFSEKVTHIGDQFLASMNPASTLRRAEFPNAQVVGEIAFYREGQTVEEIIVPKVEIIKDAAFGGCYLKELDIRKAANLHSNMFRIGASFTTTFRSNAVLHAHVNVESDTNILYAKDQGVMVKIYDNNGNYLYDL